MENQNHKNTNQAPSAAPGEGRGNASARSGHGRHRGGRGRGAHKGGAGQEIRTKQGAYIGDAADQSARPQGVGNAERQGNRGQQGNRQSAPAQQGNKKGRDRGRRGGDRRDASYGKGGASRTDLSTSDGLLSNKSAGVAQAFKPSPTLSRSIGDVWLDDTFSPLHEAEINDPAAEAEARRILDAEGPLLFGKPHGQRGEKTADQGSSGTVEIVGIRFKTPGKMYFFAPGKLRLKRGTYAIVETARGEEYGEVCRENSYIAADEVVQPLRPVLRAATEADAKHHEENQRREQEAFRICQQKIVEHGLDMKLVEAQYTFDNSKLLFYFTSDGRVDFRELVKDLAGVFRTRIELRQIGIRDEAKLLGGLGTCGRPLCCSGFLPDFVQVSIKMAKEQNLSLNSTKISGCCGRLMCCLRYEVETYETEIRLTPSVGSTVETADGRGEVVANHPLKGTVTVRLADHADEQPRVYHRDGVQLCYKSRSAPKQEAQDEAETEES